MAVDAETHVDLVHWFNPVHSLEPARDIPGRPPRPRYAAYARSERSLAACKRDSSESRTAVVNRRSMAASPARYRRVMHCHDNPHSAGSAGRPQFAERRAYSWQYWHGILLIPACTRWLNGTGCSTPSRGAHGRSERATMAIPLTNRNSATGISMRFIVSNLAHTTALPQGSTQRRQAPSIQNAEHK